MEDIVMLKNELYSKLKVVDIKVLTLMKNSIVGCDYFRNPMYIACNKLQENLETLKLEEVRDGITLAYEFIAMLDEALDNTTCEGEGK